MPKSDDRSDDSNPGKPGLGQRLKDRFTALRERHRWLDHVVRMHQHYSKARGNHLAGAITYFGFLSMFPLIAIGFAVLSYITRYYPEARAQVEQALSENLPGLVGPGPNQINVNDIANSGAARVSAGIAGILGLLYAGLGWLDALREALRQMWAVEPGGGNIVVRKIIDLFVLALLGGTLLLTTASSSLAAALTTEALDLVGLGGGGAAAALLKVVAVLFAVFANTLLLTIIFARLPGHRLPWKNLLTGALLGAVGIEILKFVGTRLLAGTTGNPVYGTFAVIVGLLVWFNFISRVVMYAAAWCVVGPVPTLEAQLAAEGETLDEEEAEAATEARRRRGDDERVPVSERYKTSAGEVPVTTSGIAGASGGPAPGGDTGGGRDRSGDGSGSRRAGAAPAGQASGSAGRQDRRAPDGGRAPDGRASGGLTSFAGVLALLAVRRRARDGRGERARG